jgi:hypothetical protein
MNDGGGMAEFESALFMPCSDCGITHIRADLEYPNGSYANADTGMWLHHTVFYNMNRTDTTCSKWPERIFASGNERTPADLTLNEYVKNLSVITLALRHFIPSPLPSRTIVRDAR